MSVYGTDKKYPVCDGILANPHVGSSYLVCTEDIHHGSRIIEGEPALTVEEFIKKHNLEAE